MGANKVSSQRFRRACALVGVPLMVVALWNPAAAVIGQNGSVAPRLSGAQLVADLMRGEVESEIDGIDGTCFGGLAAAPDWFGREVLPLDDAQEVRANEAWSVVGFQRDGPPSEVLSWIADETLSRGWRVMESGVAGTVTGIKEEGRCRWMAISCTAVGDATCVVVQLPAAL